MVCSGPHAGCILGQTFDTHVLFSQVSWTESNIQDIFPYKDAIGSFECVGNPFWEASANFITLDTKVVSSAESC